MLTIGRGRVVKEASPGAARKVAILSIGTRLAAAIEAARMVDADNAGSSPESSVSVTVADARFMRPLDVQLIRSLASEHDILVTVEEGSVGGFGDHVLHMLATDGLLDDGKLKVRPMVLPDKFIEAGTQAEQYEEAGLTPAYIAATVDKLLGKQRVLV